MLRSGLRLTYISENEYFTRYRRIRLGFEPFTTVFRPGDCWYAPWLRFSANVVYKYEFSEYYKNLYHQTRSPIFVMCPDKTVFCLDQQLKNQDGWTVCGILPVITVVPGIKTPTWRGEIIDGYFRTGVTSSCREA